LGAACNSAHATWDGKGDASLRTRPKKGADHLVEGGGMIVVGFSVGASLAGDEGIPCIWPHA